MEIANRTLVIMLVLVMLVVVLTSFFLFQSGSQISKADATRIFQQSCDQFAKRGCSWDVTYDQDFDKFVQACKIVNGEEFTTPPTIEDPAVPALLVHAVRG